MPNNKMTPEGKFQTGDLMTLKNTAPDIIPFGNKYINLDLSVQPSLFKRLMAKLFGQTMVGKDDNVVVKMKFWNGCYYVEEVRNDHN